MKRIVRCVLKALRPRNLLAALGFLVLVQVVADQVFLFKIKIVEQEASNAKPIKDFAEPGSSNNAAALYRYAYWLNTRIDGEMKGQFPEIECPQAGYYSCALDGRPCCSGKSAPLSPEQLELYGGVLAAKQPVYDLISRATALPACVFTTSYAPEMWQSPNYEECKTLSEMMRLLWDAARWNARHGDAEGAWERLRELLVCLKRQGGIDAVSTRLMQESWLRYTFSAIVDVADAGSVPESVSPEFFAVLQSLCDPQTALDTVEFETARYVQNIDLQMTASTLGNWVRPLANLDKLYTHKTYVQFQQAMSRKTPRERMAAVKGLVEAEHLSGFLAYRAVRPWRLFSNDPFLSVWYAYDLSDISLISCRMLQTGVALKKQRQREGGYPEDLAVTAKELPADATIDPVTDKPFEYRIEGAGFILKSPGPKVFDDNSSRQFAPREILWQAKN